ncbi:MAG: hypothetical protein ACOCUT_02845 [bacterium]
MKQIKRKTHTSSGSVLFLLGIAAVFSIVALFLYFQSIMLATLLSFFVLIFFILLASLTRQKQVKIRKINKPTPISLKQQGYVCKPEEQEYVASEKTKKYHHKSCRFAKMIKDSDKISNNNPGFFRKNNYEGCKQCIK